MSKEQNVEGVDITIHGNTIVPVLLLLTTLDQPVKFPASK
jgi:hypothetical protein